MAQYISVKRKQQTNKHAPLAIMLCLLFLFSSFSFSFADYTDGFLIAENGESYEISASLWVTNRETETFYYAVVGTDLYACVKGDLRSSNLHLYTGSNTNVGILNSYDTTYDFTYRNYSSQGTNVNATLNSGLTRFTSKEYFFEAVNSYLEGSSGGGITNNGNAIITVNPGNVAYIGYDSATFNFLINLSKPVSSYNSNARYGFASELPSGSITFTPSSGNALPLRKSIPDLLGRAATWVGSVDTDTIGYFIVYNPVYDLNGNTNPPIKVTVTIGYMNVTQFPLTASDIGGDIISSGNSDNFYISDGVQGGTDLPSYIYSQTDQNGNVTTSPALTVPVTPYNYTTQDAGNAESGLQGFLQQILDLLTAPVKLITNLYNAAVGFFNYLSSLWSWLPPELTKIIVSALGVLVVIGVVKFLWK